MISLLALGDSYTVGEAVDPASCWPLLLAAELGREGLVLEKIDVVARTGWSTDELAAEIERVKLHRSHSIVTLLIGVNNQYRGRSHIEYEIQFADLVNSAVTFASGDPSRVIVISIPDWSVTPYALGRNLAMIAAEIDRFNAINKTISRGLMTNYVDVTGISRQALLEPFLIAADGLHPSPEMYQRWVVELLPIARAIVRRQELPTREPSPTS